MMWPKWSGPLAYGRALVTRIFRDMMLWSFVAAAIIAR